MVAATGATTATETDVLDVEEVVEEVVEEEMGIVATTGVIAVAAAGIAKGSQKNLARR